jgi:hypothetical protein
MRMRRERGLRAALWCSVVVNALGVVVIAPLAVGRPSPLLPVAVSPFLAGQLGFVVLLFGGVYGWLARQSTVHRPLLFVGALGKLGFFSIAIAYSISGIVPARVALSALPDLVLGALFLLAVTRHP